MLELQKVYTGPQALRSRQAHRGSQAGTGHRRHHQARVKRKPVRAVAQGSRGYEERAAQNVSLYPDGSCFELRNAMAAHLGVPPDMLIFGAGGDEVIFHLAMAFVEPGSEIIQADPTFSEYGTASKIMDANIISVPLKDCTHDLPAMLDKVNDRTRLFVDHQPEQPHRHDRAGR